MIIQQYTVVQLIRKSVGVGAPEYFILDCNTLFRCQSLVTKINQAMSKLLVSSIWADLTLQLNYQNFPVFQGPMPFYLVTE